MASCSLYGTLAALASSCIRRPMSSQGRSRLRVGAPWSSSPRACSRKGALSFSSLGVWRRGNARSGYARGRAAPEPVARPAHAPRSLTSHVRSRRHVGYEPSGHARFIRPAHETRPIRLHGADSLLPRSTSYARRMKRLVLRTMASTSYAPRKSSRVCYVAGMKQTCRRRNRAWTGPSRLGAPPPRRPGHAGMGPPAPGTAPRSGRAARPSTRGSP